MEMKQEGQLIFTPNPVVLDGQQLIPMDLRPGESLYVFLQRHITDLDGAPWEVSIGGVQIDRHMWHLVRPKDGQIIEVRGGVAGRSALMLVALAALTIFTVGLSTPLAAAGWSALAIAGTQAAVYIAGSLIINKVLGPKKPSATSNDTDSVYSINSQRNSARQYEPLPLVFGRVRVTPDLASNPYTWYQGNDQYLGLTLTPGLNVGRVEDLYNGDALLSSFDGVSTWFNNFPEMASQAIPLYSNADTIAGGDLTAEDKHTPGPWVQRTTSDNTIRIQVDLEYVLFDTTSKGKPKTNQETFNIQYRPVGESTWQLFGNYSVQSDSQKTQRVSYGKDVPAGQYEVQVRIAGMNTDGSGANAQFTWSSMTSVQPDTANYAGIPRIGISIKATGQLSGSLDEVRTVAHSRPAEVWTGTEWVTEETSNPGAHILRYARGIYDENGARIAGIGLDDSQIDIASLQVFMLHCAANNYEYNYCIKDARSHDDVLGTIALAGFGELTWAGGRLSVIFATDEQPESGVVNMATIKRGAFQVDYALAAAADGVEYTYIDSTTWETTTLRVAAPGVTTMLQPAQLTGEGVGTEEHAAQMARWHLAQSLYQYKDISYSTDLEHLSYRRMSMLSLQHDMTQWGYGGRIVSASKTSGGVVTLVLDDTVPAPPPSNGFIGLRIPGEGVYRVFQVVNFGGPTNTVTLTGVWPNDAPLPGSPGNPAHDTLWCFDFKSTPGQRVRVTAIEPENGMTGARVTCVPESAEFWHYVYTGEYIPPQSGSLLPTRPVASNLKVTEVQQVQGDTIYTELQVTFDITGGIMGDAVVLSDLDGNAEVEEVARTTTRSASFRIPRAGTYTISVRPLTPDGLPGVAASIIYTTTGADAPPVLVDLFDIIDGSGGLRKYTWGFYSTTIQSADFTGVEIRYIASDAMDPQPNWDNMTPVGETGYHAAAFESTVPVAGNWTFACRSVNTSGTLSTAARYVTKTLGKNLDELHNETSQDIVDAFNQIYEETQARVAADQDLADAVSAEATARADAIQGEADARAADVADLNAGIAANATAILNEQIDREAAITAEAATRQSVDESLAYQISQVSAGTGEQFDSKKIWYFDTTNEGWNGTVTDGWLNPGAAVATSPSGLGIVGAQYRYVKMRVQKVGSPTWLGKIGWTLAAGGGTGSANITTEPSWNPEGIATVDLDDIDWTAGTVDSINVQLGTSVNGSNYYLFDFVAIGRPTPGASVAMVQDETTARIAGDAAEATARQTLASQTRGDYTGTDVAGVTTGLFYSERTARTTADSAMASDITSLQARMPAGSGTLATHAEVLSEQQARVDGDSALASDITALNAEMDGKASASALAELQTEVTEIDGQVTAMAESVQYLSAQLDGENAGDTDWNAGDTNVYAGSLTVYTVIADGDHANAVAIEQVTAEFGEFESQVTVQLEAFSDDLSAQSTALTALTATVNGKADEADVTAVADTVTLLSARVDVVEDGVTANANSITSLTATVGGKANQSDLTALANTVSTMNATVTQQGTDITANANAITSVSATVGTKADASVVQALSVSVSAQGGTITAINAQYFLAVDVNGRVGGMKIGNNGSIVDFQILADKFTIVSPSGGQRFEYSAGNIRVYDASNVLRVRLGVW